MTDFVHLHLHTEYSLLDGAVKCGELMDYCAQNGIKAVAITDHGNMYATLKFAETARKKNIKAIIGCEFYCCDDYRVKNAANGEFDHLILLAKNKIGYRNLVQLDSIAFVDGFYYKPRIDYRILKEHSEGVICLSACLAGRIPKSIVKGNYDKAKETALYLKGIFGEDFYIEIQDHGIPEQKFCNPELVRLAREIGVKIVATNDVHYLKKEDAEMQDVLMCIQMKRTLDDPKRMKFETQEFYFKSGDEMAALFPQWPEAISNTLEIADKVTEPAFDLTEDGTPIRDNSLIPLYQPGDEFRRIPLECLRFMEENGRASGAFLRDLEANGLVREAAGTLDSDYAFFLYNGAEMHAVYPAWDPKNPKTLVAAEKKTLQGKRPERFLLLDHAGKPIPDYRGEAVFPEGFPYSEITGYDSKGYLTQLTEEGLKRRYREITPTILQRKDYELDVICSMGYADYYLVVWDYINWSKRNEIPVGPGRGSGVSSIVAYAIGITDVEPLQYDLLFERFLNPSRKSMPDFDVDFCTERRQETIEYVRAKYGPENVVQIVTFGTMASKQAIKDTGRVMRIPYAETDRVAKLMDGKSEIRDLLGLNLPKLEKQYAEEPNGEKREALKTKLEEMGKKKNREFIEIYEGDEQLHRVIDMAMRIEGMPRNTSMHAAGVVICQQRIADHVPLSRNGEDITTQFNMKEIESLGMLKMDFLALTTLTDLKKSYDYIKQNYGVRIDFDEIGYDDPETYRMIGEGQTDGVFQLEQGGMKRFMRELKPDCLEDLIAGVSLYRPGPMKDIKHYCDNKNHPELIRYETPLLEPILKVTYGISIYQEQVMNIFRSLAGFTLGMADNVRRAMGKKDKKTLLEQRELFIYGGFVKGDKTDENGKPQMIEIKGCIKNGVPEKVASQLFQSMESFASYAFNKSHAAAYAVIAYQTAYLKCHYVKEFLAGLLNNRITKSDEITKYAVYMKEQNMPLYPPDINRSEAEFSVEGDGLRFGLCALKGIGRNAIDDVIAERTQKGDFVDFSDFLMRCTRYLNKRIVESLIYGGAFDCFGKTRRQLCAVYDEAMNRIAAINKQQDSAQISLFGSILDEKPVEISYPALGEFELNEKLSKEKQVLGVYVSGHPFEKYKDAFRNASFNCAALQDYREEEGEEEGEIVRIYENLREGQQVTMGGIISAIRKVTTKSGALMGILTVEDMYGSVECVAYPKLYDRIKNSALIDKVVSLTGTLNLSDKTPAIRLDSLEEFALPARENRETTAQEVLWLNATELDEADFEDLLSMFQSYPGETEVRIVRSGKKFRVSQGVLLSAQFYAELQAYLPDPACRKLVS